jgi:spore germination protein KB
MSNDNGKISVRQSMILIILLFFAPTIRYIPIFTVQQAKHSAWLSPFIAVCFEVVYMLIWASFIKKYASKSYIDIVKDVVGKILGNVIIIMYFLWITFLLSYNVRMYVERILSSAMPNVSIYIILGSMLLLVGYVVKNGIITLAKMCEFFFILLAIIFVVYSILILPSLHMENLFPITYKDTLPTFIASFGIVSIFAYNILIFIFNDKIDHKGEFKKLSIQTTIILTIFSIFIIVIPLGIFGWSLLIKLPMPFLTSMMEISLYNIIERLEAGIIIYWMIADFSLIAIFVYSVMHMFRLSFKLSNVMPLKVIYIVGIFFLSLILAKSTLELKILSQTVITIYNIIMGYAIPILIYIIAKIRKKV